MDARLYILAGTFLLFLVALGYLVHAVASARQERRRLAEAASNRVHELLDYDAAEIPSTEPAVTGLLSEDVPEVVADLAPPVHDVLSTPLRIGDWRPDAVKDEEPRVLDVLPPLVDAPPVAEVSPEPEPEPEPEPLFAFEPAIDEPCAPAADFDTGEAIELPETVLTDEVTVSEPLTGVGLPVADSLSVELEDMQETGDTAAVAERAELDTETVAPEDEAAPDLDREDSVADIPDALEPPSQPIAEPWFLSVEPQEDLLAPESGYESEAGEGFADESDQSMPALYEGIEAPIPEPAAPPAEAPVLEPTATPPVQAVAPESALPIIVHPLPAPVHPAESGAAAPDTQLSEPAPHIPHEIADVPEFKPVAPVEMWFGEARVGVKPGTKTYDLFQRYAAALLEELANARDSS